MSLNHLFVLCYLTVLVYCKTTIHLSVGGYRWILGSLRNDDADGNDDGTKQ